MKTVILGTRGSQLALWQTNCIKAQILKFAKGTSVQIQVIKTSGDLIQNKPLPEIGSKGLFTQEIEDALLDERIDVAVHSLKDLPSVLPNGLIYAGSPERADCRDAFISISGLPIEKLPKTARIATGSMGRKSQILERFPNMSCRPWRGNITTRRRTSKEEGGDGIFLERAALERLELTH